MTIAEEIRSFVATEVVVDRSVAFDEDLVDADLLDSAGLVALVGFLEDRFGIVLDDESDLVVENFRTIHTIVALVERKLGAGAE
jgi:acyl carrier protein